MGDIRQPNACLTCPTIRPDADPRLPHHPPVCDGDRALLDRWLTEIANLHATLVNPAPMETDRRRYERWGRDNKTGHDISLGQTWADPLAPVGGVGPIASKKNNQPSVSGSRERSLPISADTVDLTAEAREPNPTEQGRRHADDQIGYLSAATILDSWVRCWREDLWPDHHLPPATVDELVSWLRHRLWDACDHHSAIDEFAAELRALRGALRRAAGETAPRPERIQGVSCARCRAANVLFTHPDDEYKAECGNCGLIYTQQEFFDAVREQAGEVKADRSPEEIHAILRSA